jgi:hypothetical protein
VRSAEFPRQAASSRAYFGISEFCLTDSKFEAISFAIHSTEGRFANVTNAGLDAMDAEARETSVADADGEVVWS